MATEAVAAPAVARAEERGLKADAIGFVDALVIGLASPAPAYVGDHGLGDRKMVP